MTNILGGSIVGKIRYLIQNTYMDDVEKRLKRIEGQIFGIRKMYKEERDCMEIAQQVAAVRSALAGVGREILSGEAVRCSASQKDRKKFANIVKKLFELS